MRHGRSICSAVCGAKPKAPITMHRPPPKRAIRRSSSWSRRWQPRTSIVAAIEVHLRIAQENLKDEQQSYDVVQARFQRGFTTELDQVLAARQLAEVQAEIAPLQSARDADQRRLAVLLGEYPGALQTELNISQPLPRLPARIEPGLPIELLRRRPDIRRAERQFAAATARIGVATSALYPHVVLTGGLGFQGQGLGRTPVENMFIGSIGPAAYWPLLDFGTLDALVQVQDYRTRELLLNYQKTVLTAVEEVDNAVDSYASQQTHLKSLEDALTAAQRAATVVSERYDRGFTNYLDVLDAQRELYTLQAQYAATQEDVIPCSSSTSYIAHSAGDGSNNKPSRKSASCSRRFSAVGRDLSHHDKTELSALIALGRTARHSSLARQQSKRMPKPSRLRMAGGLAKSCSLDIGEVPLVQRHLSLVTCHLWYAPLDDGAPDDHAAWQLAL